MVQDVRSERGARSYLGRYIGKERQKHLPEGVTGAGRWWSRSRGLKAVVLDECFWLNTDDRIKQPRELRVCRSVRKYLSKNFGFKYRGCWEPANSEPYSTAPAEAIRRPKTSSSGIPWERRTGWS